MHNPNSIWLRAKYGIQSAQWVYLKNAAAFPHFQLYAQFPTLKISKSSSSIQPRWVVARCGHSRAPESASVFSLGVFLIKNWQGPAGALNCSTQRSPWVPHLYRGEDEVCWKRKNLQQREKSEHVSWLDQVKREFKDFKLNIPFLLLRIQFLLDLSNLMVFKHQDVSELPGNPGFKKAQVFQGSFHSFLTGSRISPGNLLLYQGLQRLWHMILFEHNKSQGKTSNQ